MLLWSWERIATLLGPRPLLRLPLPARTRLPLHLLRPRWLNRLNSEPVIAQVCCHHEDQRKEDIKGGSGVETPFVPRPILRLPIPALTRLLLLLPLRRLNRLNSGRVTAQLGFCFIVGCYL